MNPIDRRISGLFLLSGIGGLVYEVVWAKQLALLFGNTAHAHAIVLATFLGGLAIGNALLGPFADRARAPLRLYGLLEIAIGVTGGLSPWLLGEAGDLYISLVHGSVQGGPAALALRLALSAAVMLPTTVLMGGTLPALSRFTARSLRGAEATVSWLYFLNSGGAVLGSLLAGFVLVPRYGIAAGALAAAVLNIGIGLASLALARRPHPRVVDDEADDGAHAHAARVYGPTEVRITLVVIGLSGFVSLAFQIAWIRVLSLILGSSTYSFTLMVSAFICGIAVGGFLIARRILPALDSFTFLGIAEVGVALSVLVTLPLYERLPYLFGTLRSALSSTGEAFVLYEALKFGVCLALMLLPATFIGMTLPLATRVAMASVDEVGKTVGRVFSVNTTGNVIGALAAGVLLLPAVGVKGLLYGGVAATGMLGAVVLVRADWPTARKLQLAAIAAVVAAVSLAVAPGGWHIGVLASASYRRQPLPDTFQEFRRQHLGNPVLFHQDDPGVTVTVHQMPGQAGPELGMLVNGKPDASTGPFDMRTQKLLGHVPMLVSPRSDSCLIIGLGSGVTAGAVLTHDVDSVDVVEISAAVVNAADLFAEVAGHPLDDPRTTVFTEDAKTYMRLVDATYDVIISEPSNPWVAGIGSLFSTEFYQQVKERLHPQGVLAQWLHTYEIDSPSVQLILRTVISEFPHVGVWELGDSHDILLVSSMEPLEPDLQRLAADLAAPRVAASLGSVGIHNVVTLLASEVAGTETVTALAGQGPLNRDLFPILEYSAPRGFFMSESTSLLIDADERFGPQGGGNLLLARYLYANPELPAADFDALIAYYQAQGNDRVWRGAIRLRSARFPDDPNSWWRAAQRAYRDEQYEAAALEVARLLELDATNGRALGLNASITYRRYSQLRSVFQPGSFADVLAAYDHWEAQVSDPVPAILSRAEMLSEERRVVEALDTVERAAAHRSRQPGLPEMMDILKHGHDLAARHGDRARASRFEQWAWSLQRKP